MAWLQRRAENVAAAFLAAIFALFVLQVFARYVLNDPLGWTVEACLIAWVWLVFWGSGLTLADRDHIRFDVVYAGAPPPLRRLFAIAAALAIVAAFAVSFPAALDYVLFMRVERSGVLRLRLDHVFAVYLVFAVAVILRYGLRAVRLVAGAPLDSVDGPGNTSGTGG